MTNEAFHPALLAAVQRNRDFFSGKRQYLVKVKLLGVDDNSFGVKAYKDAVENLSAEERKAMEAMQGKLVPEIPYEGLDWKNDFDKYYKSRVQNAKVRAEYRLNMDLGDDYIPSYFPYFGIAIHHAFFGGHVDFNGGTSYCHPVIEKAEQWEDLHFSVENEWTQRLGEAMSFCNEHGDGVLLASLRGGNGPMDMANGVLGNQLFLDLMLDEENAEHLMQVCADACDAMYQFQQSCASEICGGRIAAQGSLWMPKPMFGHISSDAAHMAGPSLYNEFEKPLIEKLAEKYQGFLFHSHMMGHRMHRDFANTKGIDILRPVEDPNQPTIKEKIDDLLAQLGQKVLMLEVLKEDIPDIIPKFKEKRGIFELTARSRADAQEQLEQIARLLGNTAP